MNGKCLCDASGFLLQATETVVLQPGLRNFVWIGLERTRRISLALYSNPERLTEVTPASKQLRAYGAGKDLLCLSQAEGWE